MRHLTLGEMMTRNVKSVRESDLLSSADWDMVVGEVRHLPVVDDRGHVVGMVSDRDVLRAAGLQHVSVARIMNREVLTAGPTTPAVDAVIRILQAKQTAILVVDDNGVLLGIVTTTDFVELAHRALAGLDVDLPHARA